MQIRVGAGRQGLDWFRLMIRVIRQIWAVACEHVARLKLAQAFDEGALCYIVRMSLICICFSIGRMDSESRVTVFIVFGVFVVSIWAFASLSWLRRQRNEVFFFRFHTNFSFLDAAAEAAFFSICRIAEVYSIGFSRRLQRAAL